MKARRHRSSGRVWVPAGQIEDIATFDDHGATRARGLGRYATLLKISRVRHDHEAASRSSVQMWRSRHAVARCRPMTFSAPRSRARIPEGVKRRGPRVRKQERSEA